MFGHATILRVGDLRNRLRWLVASAIALTITLACAHSSAAPVSVTVLDDTPDHTVVALELLHYGADLVTVQGQAMSAVRLAGEPRLKVKGAPSLPTVSRSVMIDAQSRVELSIIDTTHHDVTDVDIAPSKGILYRNVLPSSVPYTLGPAYQQDAFFPASPAKLGQPYVMRDVRGAAITFQPFQYNPVSRVLRVYDRIVVKVAKVPGAPHNPLVVAPTGTSLAFHNLSAGHFLNHGTKAAYAPLDEDGDLLIIVDDAWLSNVQPLVAHKNSIGIDTTAVGVSQVGNNASSIKSYIQNAYQSGNLAFVLLVGDVSQVATPYAQGGAADPTYAKVAGSDGYPDILVGRFSAETAAHVDTQVQRTIDYEVNNATQQPWFKKGVGIGSNEGPGDDGEYDYQHIVQAVFLDYPKVKGVAEQLKNDFGFYIKDGLKSPF